MLTINNPNKEEDLATLRRHCTYFIGQLEQGASGTEHLQIFYQHPTKQRITGIKNIFPRAHIEIARDTKASIAYVTKEDTRVDGPYEHGVPPETRQKDNFKLTVAKCKTMTEEQL